MTTSPIHHSGAGGAAHVHSTACHWQLSDARWVCGPVPAEPPLVDVRDMVVVHTALLREFRLLPAAVRRTAAGDRRQAGVVVRHLRLLCDLLHHHHAGEDELLWPLLRERAVGASAQAALDGVDGQHAAIEEALDSVRNALDCWLSDAGAASGVELAARLTTLHALLADHLELEETAVLPLAAALLTPDEWGAVGKAAAGSMPKPVLALVFGMFAYEGDPAVLTDMLRSAPPVPRRVLPHVAPRLYARRARAVHGSPRP